MYCRYTLSSNLDLGQMREFATVVTTEVDSYDFLLWWLWGLTVDCEFLETTRGTETDAILLMDVDSEGMVSIVISYEYGWNHRNTTWTSIQSLRIPEGVRSCKLVCSNERYGSCEFPENIHTHVCITQRDSVVTDRTWTLSHDTHTHLVLVVVVSLVVRIVDKSRLLSTKQV